MIIQPVFSSFGLYNGQPANSKLLRDWEVHGWRYKETAALVPQNAMSVLDLGCNNGYVSHLVTRGLDRRVLAVDCSPTLVNLANMMFWTERNRNAVAVVADVTDPHFWDHLDRASYGWDVILMTEFLEHLEPDEAYIVQKEALSRTKLCIVSVPREDRIPSPGHKHEYTLTKLVRPYKEYEVVDLHPNHLCVLAKS